MTHLRLSAVALVSIASGCFSPASATPAGDDSGSTTGTADSGTESAETLPPTSSSTADPTSGSMTASPTTASSTTAQPTEGDSSGGDTTGAESESESSGTSSGDDPLCGDGEVEGDEVCDDGTNDGAYGGCASDCSALAAHCGDNNADPREACDDGNDQNGDGCNIDCVVSGTPLMVLRYDSPAHLSDVARGVAVGPDGDFVVVGTVDRTDLGEDSNIWIRKYTEDGEVVWTETFDVENGTDNVRDVAVDPDGNIAVNGYETVAVSGIDVWTALYDSDGEQQWVQTHNSPGNETDVGHGVGFDADGFVYAGGYEGRVDIGQNRNIWTAKYGASGTLQWAETYNNPDNGQDRCRAFRVNASGVGVCIGYEFRADLGESFNMLAVVRDADGAQQWTATHNDTIDLDDTAWGGAINDAGEVVVCGHTRMSATDGDYDIWVGKYDPTGSLDWSARYDGGDADNCDTAVFDADQNVIVGGSVGGEDAWVEKYDPDGEVLWTQVHEGIGGGFDAAVGNDVWPDGRVVVVGYENFDSAGESNNMWIQVYAP